MKGLSYQTLHAKKIIIYKEHIKKATTSMFN